jgi:hypothetical protein
LAGPAIVTYTSRFRARHFIMAVDEFKSKVQAARMLESAAAH